MNYSPVFKEIILVGGGHAHALVIKQWGMKPLPGVRLTLISPDAQTPYSGMLPGLVAGHYNFDQIHIDLIKACHWAGVRFIQGRVSNIDPDGKALQMKNRPDLNYDLLSLDIGSTPNHSIAGVREFSSPIKPIAGFYTHWKNTLEELRQSNSDKVIAVVGGGAGSVETILAMAWAVCNDPNISIKVQFKLFFKADSILPSYPKAVIKRADQQCLKMGVELMSNFFVNAVESDNLSDDQGGKHNYDFLFWCTQASAPEWIAKTGIACNEEGFLRVNEYLQAVNYPTIFAAGDIAHMDLSPRPKAGVYSVRQAPILFNNLRLKIIDQALRPYRPQDTFLSLLSLGDKTAVGHRRALPIFFGKWVWRWKKRIDEKFMDGFQALPAMHKSKETKVNSALIPAQERQEKLNIEERCGACGAKIGSNILSEVLTELYGSYHPEDASTIDWPSNRLIQTIDLLKAPFDDPYLFGRISVFHALSDLFAMNAQAHSIQIAVTLPFAGRDIQARELRQLLQGVKSACDESAVLLLGGHSAEGSDLSLSISANGMLVPGQQQFSKEGLQAGDLLVLSKPLGTGLILAAQMQQLSHGKDISLALDWMNRSNKTTASILSKLNVKSCTDVTGFGLLGHLSEMLGDSDLELELFIDDIPCLPGAVKLAQQGIRSSLFPQNELSLANDKRWDSYRKSKLWPLLLDPQTSGGLLAGIRSEQEQLAKDAGLMVIGRIY